jgi:hypothetical protein
MRPKRPHGPDGATFHGAFRLGTREWVPDPVPAPLERRRDTPSKLARVGDEELSRITPVHPAAEHRVDRREPQAAPRARKAARARVSLSPNLARS